MRSTGYSSGIEPVLRNVPTLVGRRAELGTIDAVLTAQRCAWVSGLGGIGKTRLARELFAQRGGAWVDVGALSDPSDLGGAIAGALGFPSGTTPSASAIGAWASAHGVPLLVLDAVDALAGPIRGWVDLLAPRVPVLVTSRVAGPEGTDVALAPLDPESDGTALFCARLPSRRVGALDPSRAEDARAVRELVALLGGLPLAIELAAARLSILPLPRLQRELERSLALLRDPLTGGRSASIEATLRWSWERLDGDEAEVLTAASVFDGPLPAEGIAAVLDRSEETLLDPLHSLVRLHLVEPARAAEARFDLHALVRRFARERLRERGGWEQAVARHASWTGARASALYRRIHGVADRESFALARELSVEARAVAARIEASPSLVSPDDACRAALLLTDIGHTDVYMQSEALFERASGADRALFLPLLRRRTSSRIRARDLEGALADAHRGVAISESAAERADFRGRAAAARLAEDPTDEGAVALLEAQIAEAGDEEVVAILRSLRAVYVHVPRGEHLRALADKEARLLWARKEPIVEAYLLDSIGSSLASQGRMDEATARISEAIDRFEACGLLGPASEARGRLAAVRFLEGRLDEAAELYALAIDACERLGDRSNLAHHRAGRALLAIERGEDPGPLLAAVDPADIQGSWVMTRVTLHCAIGCAALDRGDALPAPFHTGAGPLDPAAARTAETIDRGLSLLATARAHLDADDRTAAAAAIEAVRELTERGPDRWDVGRVFVRIARARVQQLGARVHAWRLARDGARFAPPLGDWTDLSHRPTLARLVAALADGEPKTLAALGSEVWPGERMVLHSLRNRIQVAVSTLRKLGLTILETTPSGYQLQRDVAVEIE